MINGPAGRIEGRYVHGKQPNAPVALFLHPHPQHGGTMNNKIVQLLYQTFVKRGFATLRFNFRGVGKSQGVFDNGIGELSDAEVDHDRLALAVGRANTAARAAYDKLGFAEVGAYDYWSG